MAKYTNTAGFKGVSEEDTEETSERLPRSLFFLIIGGVVAIVVVAFLIVHAVTSHHGDTATADEAVQLLGQYDFNSMTKMGQHLYIADAQGKSVVVEWQLNNTPGANRGFEMHVTESPVCTNFLLCNGRTTGECRRFDTIAQRLAEKPINTPEDAMENLKAASVSWTQWSCVYHLSDFNVDVVLDNKHDKVFHISPNDFLE